MVVIHGILMRNVMLCRCRQPEPDGELLEEYQVHHWLAVAAEPDEDTMEDLQCQPDSPSS
jgi:hypothetical protein